MISTFFGIETEYGHITILTDEDCDIYIDEEFAGRSPIDRMSLIAGTHYVRIRYIGDEINNELNKDIFNSDVSITKNEDTEIVIQGLITGFRKNEFKLRSAATTPRRGSTLDVRCSTFIFRF